MRFVPLFLIYISQSKNLRKSKKIKCAFYFCDESNPPAVENDMKIEQLIEKKSFSKFHIFYLILIIY
ncbi:hypothetical protein KUTeg_018247 [Tegillarca granosa]|uniref:Uncharacterized protein n=1 Tax=Tegillarca granosa TaxID=220873 RepID=A0ABQ9EIR5_TEGGR|nr:hypothetical protein KUTeg_018247 [Tegillarca granosa]